jgi:hypothetical protein
MIVEVGKTYINRAGSICKVVGRTDLPLRQDSFYSYFPLKDGKENREQSFYVDRFGTNHANSLGEDPRYDLIEEYKMPELQWVWGVPDKIGLWACGGHNQIETPSLTKCAVNLHIIYSFSGVHYHTAWRCYLGPIPQIAQPKKRVKQTLWMVKRHANLLWEELWLPDEETPQFKSFHDVGHKTTTTREV